MKRRYFPVWLFVFLGSWYLSSVYYDSTLALFAFKVTAGAFLSWLLYVLVYPQTRFAIIACVIASLVFFVGCSINPIYCFIAIGLAVAMFPVLLFVLALICEILVAFLSFLES